MSLLRWIAGLSALLFLPPTLGVCAAADAPRTPWRTVGVTELFRIRDSETSSRTNAPVDTGVHEDRYWRLDFEGSLSAPPPRLRIGWNAGTVYFLAQGKGPWILAFGGLRRDMAPQSPIF